MRCVREHYPSITFISLRLMIVLGLTMSRIPRFVYDCRCHNVIRRIYIILIITSQNNQSWSIHHLLTHELLIILAMNNQFNVARRGEIITRLMLPILLGASGDFISGAMHFIFRSLNIQKAGFGWFGSKSIFWRLLQDLARTTAGLNLRKKLSMKFVNVFLLSSWATVYREY